MDAAVAHIAGVYEFVNEIEEASLNLAGLSRALMGWLRVFM